MVLLKGLLINAKTKGLHNDVCSNVALLLVLVVMCDRISCVLCFAG